MQYCWSTSGEHFEGKFDTAEEAVADAAYTLGLEPGTVVEVGELVEPTVRRFVEGAVDLDNLFDAVSQDAFEFAGEAAEDWPDSIPWSDEKKTPEQRELQEKLVDLITAYLEEHDPPRFWGVDNIVKMKVPETSK